MPRFITDGEMQVEHLPWGPHDWLCRPNLTAAEELMVVRVHMPPGQGHAFHVHPEMEEVLYILDGTAEQWIDRERKILSAGHAAMIPKGVVHGTYNAGDRTLEFLAILAPAKAPGPAIVDVSNDHPWKSLRADGR